MSVTCIDCGCKIAEHDDAHVSICQYCVGGLVDKLSLNDLVPLAKLGIVAVIDERTGYQDVRMQREKELLRLFEKYKAERA